MRPQEQKALFWGWGTAGLGPSQGHLGSIGTFMIVKVPSQDSQHGSMQTGMEEKPAFMRETLGHREQVWTMAHL